MNYLKQGVHDKRIRITSRDVVECSDYLVSTYPQNLYQFYFSYLRVIKKTDKTLHVFSENNKIILYWDEENRNWFSKKHNILVIFFLKNKDLIQEEFEMIP